MNRTLEGSEGLEADVPLSDRLERLAQARDALVWPDRVTRVMANLKGAVDRVAGLMAQVSGDASSLGELAAVMDGEVLADDAVDEPACVDRPGPAPSDVEDVAQRVAREIDAYAKSDIGPGARPEPWVAGRLADLRGALVEPYELEVADGRDRRAAQRRPVLIVARDAGRALLAFDPDPEGDFVVVWPRPNGDVLSNIRGGVVACFLAT